MAVEVEYCKYETVHKLGWTIIVTVTKDSAVVVAEAAADVEEADVSFTNITRDPFPEAEAAAARYFASLEAEARITANFAPATELAFVFAVAVAKEAEEVEFPSANAATIWLETKSPMFAAAAVAEVLVAVVKVFVADAEVFFAVVKIFVMVAEVATCLACKKRASTASSMGKARHLVRQKKKNVSPTRRRGIRNMMRSP